MARQRHLANAPIVEALVDFRVRPSSDVSVSRFDTAAPEMAALGYTGKRQKTSFKLEVKGGVPQAPEITGALGIDFTTPDGGRIAQFRVDGFTLNHVAKAAKYVDWLSLKAEAMTIWRLYVATSGAELVTRTALRYINSIAVDRGRNLRLWLRAPPAIPPGLPTKVTGFVSRVSLIDAASGLRANVSQSLRAEPSDTGAAVILDVDVYRVADLPTDGPELDDTLEQLHTFKNDIFFASVTDEALERYE